MSKDTSAAVGTAAWIAAQTDPRERLIGELVFEVRANQNATHEIDDAAGEALGINATDGRCLDILDRRGRITAGQLAKEARLTTGAVTAVIDRLEERGLVRRLRDPGDRRRVLVEVTQEAVERSMELYGPLKDMGQDFFESLSDDELRLLIEFNRRSREIQERRAAEIRAELAARKDGAS